VNNKSTGENVLLVKGAWDTVLARCSRVYLNGEIVDLDKKFSSEISEKIVEYCEGENNFRCLALAELEKPANEELFHKAKN